MSGRCTLAGQFEMTTLRWLHFTDLHIGQKELKLGYWSSIRDAIHADLRRTSSKLGPFDLVIFTGDLAFSGTTDQYGTLESELEAIWKLFAEAHPEAPRPVLLAVPGNHDLAQPGREDAIAYQLLHDEQHGRDALWSNTKQQAGAVRSWFQAYAAWWERNRPQADIQPGLLPGDFAYVGGSEAC